MEREVGRGIGMGNTCKPMAVSFQCMTKFTTNKKKKKEKSPFGHHHSNKGLSKNMAAKTCGLKFDEEPDIYTVLAYFPTNAY